MKQFKLITAALSLLAMTACTEKNESNGTANGRTALQVSTASIIANSNLNANPATRATDNAWQAGDAIGITLFNADTKELADDKKAYKYVTTTAAGNFAPADVDNTAYFPKQDKKVDVTAFYPYTQPDDELTIPVSTASQESPSAIDLMTAQLATAHSNTNPTVALAFKHRLTKLLITVDNEEGVDVDLTGTTITLSGTPTTARWSLTEEKLTDQGAAADITLSATATEDAVSATAIVLPTPAGNGVKLIINTPEETFEAPLPANLALAAGTVNTLKVHLIKKELTIVEVTITDWTTGVSINHNIAIGGITDDAPVSGLTPATGDQLAITGLTNDELSTNAALQATYTYSTAWTSPTPLYWDDITVDNNGHSFVALYTPAATPAAGNEKDYLAGKTTIAFGTPITFTNDNSLKHAMSQISITLIPGKEWAANPASPTDEEKNALITTLETRHIVLNSLKSITVDSNGEGVVTFNAGDPANILASADAEVNKQFTPATTYTVAPQTLTDKHVIVMKLANGNTYTAKLTDLKNNEGEDAPLFGTDNKMLPGCKYSISITISETEVSLSATIEPWSPITGSGEALPGI